jgi:hypothetical protein
MTEPEKTEIVQAWIDLQHAADGSSEYDSRLWAHEKFWEIAEEQPDLCWELILRTLSTDQSTPIMETLSAGPLEDLLAKNGAAVIERVEKEAKANPKFAYLLGGVWQNTMPNDVWARVQAVWDRRGWDGN